MEKRGVYSSCSLLAGHGWAVALSPADSGISGLLALSDNWSSHQGLQPLQAEVPHCSKS